MNSSHVLAEVGAYYSNRLAEHGPTPRGVDWGRADDVRLRYEKMLALVPPRLAADRQRVSLLDVGCGYGGLYDYVRGQSLNLDYCGIDVAEEMIAHGQRAFPAIPFVCADALKWQPPQAFDFVVCSGILTQKLEASIKDMDRYAQMLIKRMFSLATIGVAFNVMTTRVNFMVSNLYYRNPMELLAWCMTEVSDRVRLDHAYPLYEYTIYLYHDAHA